MFMIGHQFPAETLTAVMPDGSMENNFSVLNYGKNSYTVVFFYPLDFTFVCPTELVAFDAAMEQFEARNCKVVAASVDSAHCHAAWRRTALNEGGIGEVSYPMASDLQRKWADKLGIVNEGGVTYRASYLLDKNGVVRHMVINDLPLGRSVEEMLRMVDALAFFEEHGEVCPADWKKGQKGMKATREGTGAYLAAKDGKKVA
ncbi:MAG: peroxiredoxin [Alphaproteobacteria bacterium]